MGNIRRNICQKRLGEVEGKAKNKELESKELERKGEGKGEAGKERDEGSRMVLDIIRREWQLSTETMERTRKCKDDYRKGKEEGKREKGGERRNYQSIPDCHRRSECSPYHPAKS